MTDVSKEKLESILNYALDYIGQFNKGEELRTILREELDMTDDEIDYFGFDFSYLDEEEDNRFSIIHLHDSDEDYCITASKSYVLYDAAEIYYKYMKADVGKVTLDSLAHWFDDPNWIDERLYPILCQSMNSSDEIANIIDFNFEDNELIYFMNSEEEKIYDLVDLSEAFEKSNRNNGLNTATRKNIFYANILGKELNSLTDTTESENESPSMNM